MRSIADTGLGRLTRRVRGPAAGLEEPRDVHRKLAVCVQQKIEVVVLAKVIPYASIEYLDRELKKLVADIKPIWNVMANDATGDA